MAASHPREHVHQFLSQEAPAPEHTSADLEGWQLERLELNAARGMRSAEAEVLERLPDTRVREALDALPENFRTTVLLADVEGLSYKDIANVLGIPLGTVRSRLHRGRRRLRALLIEYAREQGMVDPPAAAASTMG